MKIVKNGGLPDEASWRADLSAYFSRWMGMGRLFAWLYLVDGQVVGTAALRLDRPAPGKPGPWTGYVMSIYTKPGFRRKGVARSLMETLIAQAAALELPRLVLHPTAEGRPLYAALGFCPYRSLMVLPKEDYSGASNRGLPA